MGSKLIGDLEDSFSFFNHPFNLKGFWSSNTIVGGLAFSLIGVEFAKKMVKHKESTGDLISRNSEKLFFVCIFVPLVRNNVRN